MIYPVCAMRDEKVGFLAPTVEQNLETAKRSFAHMCSAGGQAVMNFAPADFALYKIGDYDTDSGELIPCERVFLIDGTQIGGIANVG